MLGKDKMDFFHGILWIALITGVAFVIAGIPAVKALSLSPLIVGLLLGIVYANTLRKGMPSSWTSGVAFCSKKILRLGIVLYGFRLTLTQIVGVGAPALVIDAIIVIVTLGGGYLIGSRLLKCNLRCGCGSWGGSGVKDQALQDGGRRFDGRALWNAFDVPLPDSLPQWRFGPFAGTGWALYRFDDS